MRLLVACSQTRDSRPARHHLLSTEAEAEKGVRPCDDARGHWSAESHNEERPTDEEWPRERSGEHRADHPDGSDPEEPVIVQLTDNLHRILGGRDREERHESGDPQQVGRVRKVPELEAYLVSRVKHRCPPCN